MMFSFPRLKSGLTQLLLLTAIGALSVLVLGLARSDRAAPAQEHGGSLWRETPLDSKAVDWSLFPKAYGVLTSERLMYPVDVSDWPVTIGPERQLFVDNYLVADAVAVSRTVHQPVKHPGNPIFVAQEPWELDKKVIVLQVRREANGKFRMWYSSWARFNYPGSQIRGRMPTLYAESDDGIHWVRPKLGLLEYNGSKENNWVIYGRMHGLIVHPEASDPGRRYLAAVAHEPPYVTHEGLYLYGSPDGIRWTRLRRDPILRYLEKDKSFPLEGLGDTTIVRWDNLLKCYVADAKIVFGTRSGEGTFDASFRTRGISTSPDLVHWTSPRMAIYPDALDDADAQIYGQVSFVYESTWLGLLRMYHFARTGWKQVDVELTASRDGVNWSRVGNREIFLPLGSPDSWEPDYTDPSHGGPILVGDELWFYYRGSRNLESSGKDDWEFATGLAKLRRDGFVSIDGGTQPGTLTTRPLAFGGRTLHLNAAVSDGGEIRVGILDEDGAVLNGYSLESNLPMTRDSLDFRAGWAAGEDLKAALGSGEHLRLQFQLKDAQLFSFWIE